MMDVVSIVSKEELEIAIKDVNAKIEKIEKMRTALLLYGICPDCGEALEPKERDGGLSWQCICGLQQWTSKKHIDEDIKKTRTRPELRLSCFVMGCEKEASVMQIHMPNGETLKARACEKHALYIRELGEP